MANIAPAAVFPVSGIVATTPPYSGTFIPTVWSAKLNAKFYAASVFAAITCTDWAGEIASMGDKVIINNIPDIAISDYIAGTPLNYQVPTATTIELVIDKAKSFAFALHDVMAHQSQPDLMNMFSTDASEQMRVAIDRDCFRDSVGTAAATNIGANAGVLSGAFNMGTDAAPLVLTGANVLASILNFAAVLDEQNVPETGRFVVIDPLTRTLLMSSPLAQAQLTGDSTSMIRNGLLGRIDRFDLYVSNQLPRAVAGRTFPTASAATGNAQPGAVARRALFAGQKSAVTFAANMTKTETLRNPNDFGDLVRGLQVYGQKTVKPVSLSVMVVA
jgi:hypothetical protein